MVVATLAIEVTLPTSPNYRRESRRSCTAVLGHKSLIVLLWRALISLPTAWEVCPHLPPRRAREIYLLGMWQPVVRPDALGHSGFTLVTRDWLCRRCDDGVLAAFIAIRHSRYILRGKLFFLLCRNSSVLLDFSQE